MTLFSERKGLTKPKTEIQVESMDKGLRNCIWNMLYDCYFNSSAYPFGPFLKILWHSYFKRPVDTISGRYYEDLEMLRNYYFAEQVPWFKVYDFVEFVANNYPDERKNASFIESCNTVLEKEKSAYRFVGKQITQITSREEILEIEEALDSPFAQVNAHLENALKLFSNKTNPDHRNSIKESISAVEALCRIVTRDDKATLGKALDSIEREGKIKLHGALKKAFDSLYGYTSSAEGIRHALLEEPTLDSEDAKFMLISCSAFVNYLVTKASKTGLKIEQAK